MLYYLSADSQSVKQQWPNLVFLNTYHKGETWISHGSDYEVDNSSGTLINYMAQHPRRYYSSILFIKSFNLLLYHLNFIYLDTIGSVISTWRILWSVSTISYYVMWQRTFNFIVLYCIRHEGGLRIRVKVVYL
jgi:hypothetical protein